MGSALQKWYDGCFLSRSQTVYGEEFLCSSKNSRRPQQALQMPLRSAATKPTEPHTDLIALLTCWNASHRTLPM